MIKREISIGTRQEKTKIEALERGIKATEEENEGYEEERIMKRKKETENTLEFLERRTEDERGRDAKENKKAEKGVA